MPDILVVIVLIILVLAVVLILIVLVVLLVLILAVLAVLRAVSTIVVLAVVVHLFLFSAAIRQRLLPGKNLLLVFGYRSSMSKTHTNYAANTLVL